jgi:hypothetical protein
LTEAEFQVVKSIGFLLAFASAVAALTHFDIRGRASPERIARQREVGDSM